MRHLYYVLYALSTEMSSKNTKNFKNFKKYISKFIFLPYLLFSGGFLRSFPSSQAKFLHIYHPPFLWFGFFGSYPEKPIWVLTLSIYAKTRRTIRRPPPNSSSHYNYMQLLGFLSKHHLGRLYRQMAVCSWTHQLDLRKALKMGLFKRD